MEQTEQKHTPGLAIAAPDMLEALLAQELASDMQKEGRLPDSGDERYTPFIGEWNGYEAPEIRWVHFNYRRQELRRAAIAKATSPTE